MSDRKAITPKLIVGLTIAAVGVVLLFDQLDMLDAGPYLAWWPVALIAIGVVVLMQGSMVGGLIAIGAGIWALLYNLEYIDIEIFDLWPLVLVLIGGSLLMQAFRGSKAEALSTDAGAYVNGFAVMAGLQRSSSSAGFLGGDLTAIMGGCEVDLRSAQIDKSDPVIDVFALWGGIVIRVPETWGVVGKVTPIMGAFEDKTRAPRDPKHYLVVRGTVLMGGVEVKN